MPQSKSVLFKVGFGGDRNNKVNPYYLSMKEAVEYERQFYSEELKKSDWKYLEDAGEMFLMHAYSHQFQISQTAYKFSERFGGDPSQIEVFGDDEYNIKYGQFHLNLAVGLELLLKSILLKKGEKINIPLKGDSDSSLNPKMTISFGDIIDRHLKKIFPSLIEDSLEEIKDTLKLINLRRNNIAHRLKKNLDSYAHEYRFSYITLYIYEKFFYGKNPELTKLLLKSLDRSKVTQGADFKPLIIKPRSLRERSPS